MKMTSWAWKAPLYSRVRRLPFFKNLLASEQKKLAGLFEHVPQPVGLHLDVGSGTGDSLSLFQAGKVLICMDASLAMLHQLPYSPKLLARAELLPFADQSVDFVSALGVLEYVPEAPAFFQEIRRVLRPQRFFLFTSSPPIWANQMRGIWGERLYLRSSQKVKQLFKQSGWRECGHTCTWLQEQWLLWRE